jgi:hypothetical protein
MDWTVSLSAIRLGTLPCTVAHATFDLRDGQALVWNRDGDRRCSSSSLDATYSDELLGQGYPAVPYARARWL